MKGITDRLTAIGAPIFEEDQVAMLLGSLPRSYLTIVTVLEARVDRSFSRLFFMKRIKGVVSQTILCHDQI